MIHAYDKSYLEKARTALGRMFDFAVYDLQYDISEFFKLFLSSGIASRFERGDYGVIVGVSGVELAYLVLEFAGTWKERVKPRYSIDRSEEFWVGWALAYYQWMTSLSFTDIEHYVSIQTIMGLYSPYHEMDIRHFCDKMNELYLVAKPETNLKIYRKRANLSQKKLAEQSNVPFRTIQQYEQRQKNINRAHAENLVSLARILCCDAEDLLEKVPCSTLG